MTNNTKTMIARAMHDAVENDDDSGGGAYLRAAQAVLDAISEAGMVIVPVEPTPEMKRAIAIAAWHSGTGVAPSTIWVEAIKAGNK